MTNVLDPTAVTTVLCDLDGVVWLSGTAIPGSVEAVERLHRSGRRVLFVTNNSVRRLADHEAALARIGIEATGDVVSSALAAATEIRVGERVMVVGGAGIVEAVERAGATVTSEGRIDVVVVGLDRQFDYERLRAASTAIRNGARFVATNDDATFPTPTGPVPGGGAIVAAVATASGVAPVLAGKPHEPMAQLVRAELADPATSAVMVGDRPSTDGAFARRLGCPFALVRTGVVAVGEVVEPTPDLDRADLTDVTDVLLGVTPGQR
jgi:HAD superfamily hydrolase (TIGR01450 family)